jgi:hypothetical protein
MNLGILLLNVLVQFEFVFSPLRFFKVKILGYLIYFYL